ncbi:nuclear transport factor 2 family protein [Mucilaginibacter sp. HMF5004]|uniref:nuclear transport factor 2 family protein n=1 Tax=Mucilaginibacter rivuli TaxID=2857527 RepID=UPI001C5E1647|nr:nuclear transport factor 2 family protein [Mucilaginibacter rivuli]MBW4888157.1 nuclear transport factor 2 family protein [Mucilaginibacter rivuli]
MKTLTTTILALVIVLSFGAAKADGSNNTVNSNNANAKLSVDYAINTYVNAVTMGDVKDVNNILADNLKYSIEGSNKKMVYNKEQTYLAFLEDADTIQDCITTTTVNNPTPDIAVVKVEMQYVDCIRTNYVTMSNTTQGWKVTNIYSTFK